MVGRILLAVCLAASPLAAYADTTVLDRRREPDDAAAGAEGHVHGALGGSRDQREHVEPAGLDPRAAQLQLGGFGRGAA